MDLTALQGRALVRLVDDLNALLASGEVTSQTLGTFSAPRDAGLWIDDGRAVRRDISARRVGKRPPEVT